jgi:NTP pyrophosphatase (non-canonical NTP hydrolase)
MGYKVESSESSWVTPREFSFGDYSLLASQFKLEAPPLHLVLGLTEEAGEVAGKFKKRLRGQDISNEAIIAELGDVLWYLSQVATLVDTSLEEVAKGNIRKLRERKKRGTIMGEGDNR